jgi:predicted nucleotidyltransferase
MQRFETLLSKVSQALEHAGIPYMVIGGQAVLVHGEPRFTRDIDITLGVDTDRAESIRSIARELLLKPGEEATDDFVKRNAVLSVEDPESGIVVDFIFSFLPYERQAIQRAKQVHVGTASVQFATAEDTIIHKLFAGRPRDIEDVKSIVNNTATLDKAYLTKWLDEFSSIAGRDLVKEYNTVEREVRV